MSTSPNWSAAASDPRFGYFWQTYANAQRWIDKHYRTVDEIAMTMTSVRVAKAPNSRSSSVSSSIIGQRRRKLPRAVDQLQSKRQRDLDYDNNGGDSTDISNDIPSTSSSLTQDIEEINVGGGTQESELIEEISEEMRAFMLKTIEHRKLRDAAREEERISRQEDEYVSADKIGVHGIVKPSKTAPNEQEKERLKKEEARRLYGADAEKIRAMEAALDMQFQTEYTAKKPAMWPNIPLRL